MRFTIVTILAFIAYTSHQVIAAPVPGSYQTLGIREMDRGDNSFHHHHGRAKHAHAHVPALDDEESHVTEANGPSHRESYRHRHHSHPDHELEAPAARETQDIQVRSPRRWTVDSRGRTYIIERRSPRGGRGRRHHGGGNHGGWRHGGWHHGGGHGGGRWGARRHGGRGRHRGDGDDISGERR